MLATYSLHKLGSRLCLNGAILEIGFEGRAGRVTIIEGWARSRDGNRELVGCFNLPDGQDQMLEVGQVALIWRGHRFRLSVLNAIPDAHGRWSFLSTDHVARLNPRAGHPNEHQRKPGLVS